MFFEKRRFSIEFNFQIKDFFLDEIPTNPCSSWGFVLPIIPYQVITGNYNAKGYLSKLGKSNPNAKTLQKMADYFGVSVKFILTGEQESMDKEAILSLKDERDIAKDMENIRQKIMNGSDGPLSYDGEPIPEDDAELLLGQIELMMRKLKPINKEKYNPNKNKK